MARVNNMKTAQVLDDVLQPHHNHLRTAAAITKYSGPEVTKLFSCSTQLSMKFVLLINLKLHELTIANSFLLHIAEHENFSANKYENANYCWHFHIY